MTTDDKIRNEKLQYDINREAGKISALLWGKAFERQIKKYEIQGEKQIDAITNQNKIIEALTNKRSDHEHGFFKKNLLNKYNLKK